MECSFETRKCELEAECKVPKNVFGEAFDRLRTFMEPFLRNFRRHEQVSHATTVVSGLCSDLEHKNNESIAYHFGQDRRGIQHFIGESRWDDRPLRDELANQIGTQLGEPDGVLVFDPSAFPKSGPESVGVARQWCGRLGKIDNCQVGVYLGYVSSQGHALVDCSLYLPKTWTKDKKRLRKARVPKAAQRFRTRHAMCLELLDRHGDRLPHQWITGDDELGRPADFRRELRDRNERYLLAVPCNTWIRDLEMPRPTYTGTGRPPQRPSTRADRWTSDQPECAWTKVEVRDAEKGPLIVEAIRRQVETRASDRKGVAQETFVVIRYRDRESQIVKTDYYLSNDSAETPLAEFCRAAKAEHRIEECLQRGKSDAGLADYEVRSWPGWHHHQTLSMIASWYLNVETREAKKKDAGDDILSGASWDRVDHPNNLRMRFTPRRQTTHRATLAS